MADIKALLSSLVASHPLDIDQAYDAFDLIMTGQSTPAQTAALLAMIQMRGPTVSELIGAAKVMRHHAAKVTPPPDLTIIDTCGTGGDHTGTFNISTAAAIVAAGAGRPHGIAVAKHGNRSVTSQSGSSQVLEALGVKLRVAGPTLTRCLDEAGLCFCFAPAHHPAMKHAVPVRQDLGFRTLFNLLGPLTNPAGASRQVIGVFAPDLTQTIAQVLQALGCDHALIVHGLIANDASRPSHPNAAGLDELTLTGPTKISELKSGCIRDTQVTPESLKLCGCDVQTLTVDSPEASASVIRSVLDAKPGPARDIVCLNAAAALVVADIADDLLQGLTMAAQAIDNGAAANALKTLVQITQADPNSIT